MNFRKQKNGFTLIEILLVVVIIGVLVGMAVPNLAGRGEQARRSAAQADIDGNLSVGIDLYHLDNGYYPTTEQGLRALVEQPAGEPASDNWNGPYLKKKKIPKDPWGNEYVYVSPGTHNPESYDLFSYGTDGVESSDDIVSWEKEGSQ
jgi:general secretion pathway protein G